MSGSAIFGTRAARRQSIAIALGYLCFYGSVGSFTPYSALYYRYLGFEGWQLGLLTALPALGTSLTAPLWGAVADARSAHRFILRLVLVLSAITCLVLAQTVSFVPFVVTLGALAFALVPVASLWDSYGVSSVARGGAPYGVLRLGGSFGFISMVLVTGALMRGEMSNRFIYWYALMHALGVLATLGLPSHGARQARSLRAGFSFIFRQPAYIFLLVVAFLIATSMATINLYLAIHVQHLGADTSRAGLAFATSATSELPFIGFGSVILRKLGAHRMIAIAIMMYGVRFIVLAMAPGVEWVFVAQALHGVSFGMFLVASVNLAHHLAGAEFAATAQALLTTMSFGFGIITGAFAGGAIIERFGTPTLYASDAVVMVLALVVHIWAGRWMARQHGRESGYGT